MTAHSEFKRMHSFSSVFSDKSMAMLIMAVMDI